MKRLSSLRNNTFGGLITPQHDGDAWIGLMTLIKESILNKVQDSKVINWALMKSQQLNGVV